MSNNGDMKFTLSDESAEAVTKVASLETWAVQPTMVRGRKALIDSQAPAEPTKIDVLRRKFKARRRGKGGDIAPKVKKFIAKVCSQRRKGKKDGHKEHPIEGPEGYRRSAIGRECVAAQMRKLQSLDWDKFPKKPLFNPDGQCQMKSFENFTWDQIIEYAPQCIECTCLV